MDKTFFKPVKQLRISSVSSNGDKIVIRAALKQDYGHCPDCRCRSAHSFGWHQRRLHDLPASGKPILFHLSVRRWRCRNEACNRLTFIDPNSKLFSRHSRRSKRLDCLVSCVAAASGGLPGERLLKQIGFDISDDTLLRTIKKQAAQLNCGLSAKVIGIDEWSWRQKGQYGTVIVDLETHSVIDVLDSRDTNVVRAWFEGHPGIQLISRDRCGGFARAAREGAPRAEQIADRFHILENFKYNVEQQLSLRRHKARKALLALGPYETRLASKKLGGGGCWSAAAQHNARVRLNKAESREALFTQAQSMANDGMLVADIAKKLGFKTRTISGWLRNGEMPQRRQKPATKTSPRYFEQFLDDQWEAGETNGERLLSALKKRGYLGSRATLYRFLAALRRREFFDEPERANPTFAISSLQSTPTEAAEDEPLIDPATGNIISPVIAAGLCMKPANALTPKQARKVEAMKRTAPEFAMMRSLAMRLRSLLRGKDVSKLGPWLNDAKATKLYRMIAFSHKLARDQDAVENAIKYQWSNGQTEGQVNRLKTLKRSMYGRAGIDLLRARMLPT